MATYIPNATQTTEPVESRTVESAALEFRTLKSSINSRIADLANELSDEEAARIAGDAALQTTNNQQDVRIQAIESALLAIGEGGLPGTVYVQRLSGTGVQSAFTLNVSVPTSALIDIFISGVYQHKDSFTIVDKTLTFSEAPPAGTNNIEVVISVTITNVTTDASRVSYYPEGEGALASTVQDQLRELESSAGSDMIGFIQAGTGAVSRTMQSKVREWVSVKDFGAVGDGVVDDTAAIQAAMNYCSHTSEIPDAALGTPILLVPQGRYRVSSLTAGKRVSMFCAGATFIPLDSTTPRSHLIKFTYRSRVYNLSIDMDYCTNYDTAIWVRGRYMDFFGTEIWKAKCGWVFGDPAWEGDPVNGLLGDSEVCVHGGSTNWCITSMRLYGQNTIIYVSGGHGTYSFKWTLPAGDPRKAAWEALPEYAIINVGAVIYLSDCFLGNFSGQQPCMLSKMQIADAPEYVNTFGRFHLSGTHIESGFHFYTEPHATAPVEDFTTAMCSVVGCSGYVSGGRSGYLYDGGVAGQRIKISDCSFYGNITNNAVYHVNGRATIDTESFPQVPGASREASFVILNPRGIRGLHLLSATNFSASLTPAQKTVVMSTLQQCDLASALVVSWYNTGTGEFLARSDLRNVQVSASLFLQGGSPTDFSDIGFYVNGTLVEVIQCIGVTPSASIVIPRVDQGSIITVKVGQYQSRSCSGGRITIVADT